MSIPDDLIKELELRPLPMIELVACLSALAETRNVSSSLWQKADLEIRDISSGRALSTLLWAHATAQVVPHKLLEQVRISEMSPQSLANSLWALAKLQVVINQADIQKCQEILQQKLPQFKSEEFASCVWAIGSMEKPAVDFFRELRLPKLEDFEDHQLSQLAWAFSSSGVRRVDVMESLASEMMKRDGFSLQAIANISWALRNLELLTTPWAVALSGHLQGLSARRLIENHGLPGRDDVDSLLGILWANHENHMLTSALISSLRRLGRQMDLKEKTEKTNLPQPRDEEIKGTVEPRVVLVVPGAAVIFKPHGWEVDTEATESTQKLSSFILSLGGFKGFIGRLDAPSSGLVLFATSWEGLFSLQAQRELRRLERDYLVLCQGWVDGDAEINLKLRRMGRRTEVSTYGRPACTKMKILAHLLANNGQTPQEVGNVESE